MVKKLLTTTVFLLILMIFAGCQPYNTVTSHATETQTNATVDFNNDLNAYYKYLGELGRLEDTYGKNIITLIEKGRNEKNKAKSMAGLELIVDEYDSFYKELTIMYVPEVASQMYDYYLDSIIKRRLYYKNALWDVKHPQDYNANEMQKLYSDADLAYTNAMQQTGGIHRDFNRRAEELGLKKPFPGID